jgi:hypothetical protein
MSTLTNGTSEHTRQPILAELWPGDGPCALCGNVGRLCKSHLTSKFVGDWLRQTNVTGRLRASDKPNKLVEDIQWRHLLCASCEGRLSEAETATRERIFMPLVEGRENRFRYGPWFVRFAVSLVWRWLIVLQKEGHLGNLKSLPIQVDGAEQAWREFLLGRRPTPSPHCVHVLPLDVPISGDLSDFSKHFGRYVLRGTGVATKAYGDCGYVIIKMPRLLVFGVVAAGAERRQWKCTQLHVDGGAWGVDIYELPGWVREFLKASAQAQQDAVDGLSDHQKRLTNAAVMKAIEANPAAVAESGVMRAFESDLGMFGRAAFQRSIADEDTD